MPTNTAAAAPTAAAITSATNRSACHDETTAPATAAPMAKNATWPSDTVPAQPDSRTSDTPSSA